MENKKSMICPVCGVKKYIDESEETLKEFYEFSYKNTIVTGDEVYSKVCRHVIDERKKQCINSSKNYSEDLDYKII